MRELEGVFVPVPTPFRGEDVLTDRLRENFERWNQTDLAGYVVCLLYTSPSPRD